MGHGHDDNDGLHRSLNGGNGQAWPQQRRCRGRYTRTIQSEMVDWAIVRIAGEWGLGRSLLLIGAKSLARQYKINARWFSGMMDMGLSDIALKPEGKDAKQYNKRADMGRERPIPVIPLHYCCSHSI
jgi:hypothetical protein